MSSLPLCSGFRVGDHDLRCRVAICDEIAFETLLRRHSDEPLRVARAMLKDGAADADEVLQEVTSLPIANPPTSVPPSSYRVGWPIGSVSACLLFNNQEHVDVFNCACVGTRESLEAHRDQ